MAPPRSLDPVSRLLEILVDSADAEVRDRVLLEAALASGAASSAALWRPYRLGRVEGSAPGPAASWMPVLATGGVATLPDDARVRGVLEGGLDPAISADARVLRCGGRGRRLALVLGGVRSENAVEQIEALLFAFSLVDDAGPAGADAFLASVPAALPADDEDRELDRLGHDLRNLLAGAMATKQMLDQFGHALTDERYEDADRVIDRECRRVGALVSGALGRPADRAACALSSALEALADVALAQAEFAHTQGVDVDVKAETSDDDGALALPEESLGRVLVNLLANAREAVLRGGDARRVAVELFASRARPGLVLVVEDAGPGLPPVPVEELLREGTSRGKPGGSGLGLAVVARLVGGAGGCLRVTGRPLGGTRCQVWIPRA